MRKIALLCGGLGTDPYKTFRPLIKNLRARGVTPRVVDTKNVRHHKDRAQVVRLEALRSVDLGNQVVLVSHSAAGIASDLFYEPPSLRGVVLIFPALPKWSFPLTDAFIRAVRKFCHEREYAGYHHFAREDLLGFPEVSYEIAGFIAGRFR